MCKLIEKPRTELQVGDRVHFYGAVFEIETVALYRETNQELIAEGADVVVVAIGKFIAGEPVRGYFGPGLDWNFQGNKFATVAVEV